MPKVLSQLSLLLDSTQRRQALLLMCLLVLVALGETLGIASIMPFIAVLSKPEVVESNRALAWAYGAFGFQDHRSFLLALGVTVFLILIGSLLMRALGTWAQIHFAQRCNHEWTCQLVAGYFKQPYEWFLGRNTSEISARVLHEINQVVANVLTPALQAVAQILVVLFVLGMLVAVDPVLAFSLGMGLVAAYGTVFALIRRRASRAGLQRQVANQQRFQAVQESFSGIKEVKVAGLEDEFAARFVEPSRMWTEGLKVSVLIEHLPSFAMQGLLFGGMMLALLYLVVDYGDFASALPVAGLYAFAGYRLMPALQSVYQLLAQIRASVSVLDSICADVRELNDTQAFKAPSNRAQSREADTIRMQESLALDDVWYQYPQAQRPSLRGLSLTIEVRSTVGFVGSTGAGKTTAVDFILGLLRPQAGRLLVDGRETTDADLAAWQRSIGYVPQQIFLSDDTVAANIAFGQKREDINPAAVERAARIANLHDFIMTELPEGYQTPVGERGVRLSGGQRQRIGIARAMYHDPHVLILDEATSALDNLTEQVIMDAIHNLGGQKTIILIAHRLSTVRLCNVIFVFDQGRIIAQGSFDSLLTGNETFRRLAEGEPSKSPDNG